jgi:hypothetical protein
MHVCLYLLNPSHNTLLYNVIKFLELREEREKYTKYTKYILNARKICFFDKTIRHPFADSKRAPLLETVDD